MGWNIAREGGNSFPFESIGDQVTGKIMNLEEVQQTDLQTGDPKTFDNGQPMMMYQVTLATELRNADDPADNGHRSVYLKGSRKSGCQSSLAAVLDAVRAATGGTELEPGGVLTLQYVGDGVARQRGFNAPKLYAATYQRPAMNLGAPAPVAQAPAPVAQAPAPQVVQAAAPVAQQAPVAAPVASGPTAEQVAALKAVGIDPATVYPGYQG